MADDSNKKTYTQEEVDAILAEQVNGLKANRDELAKEAKAAKAALKAYEGVDPAKYTQLVKAAEEAEHKRAAAEGDFSTLRKQLVENHTKELGEKDGKIGKLTKALEKRLVQAELTKAIAAKKGDPDLLLPYAERFVRTRETDDDYEAFIADAAGNPRVADGKGTPMGFDAFVEQELMAKFPRAFEGTGSTGGGATRSTGGASGARTVAAGDNSAFLANLDTIAAGKTDVNR